MEADRYDSHGANNYTMLGYTEVRTPLDYLIVLESRSNAAIQLGDLPEWGVSRGTGDNAWGCDDVWD